MNISKVISGIYKKFSAFLSPRPFNHTRMEDEKYLWSFFEPSDDIERSYWQYRCQKWNDGSKFKYVIYNIIAFFLYFPYELSFSKPQKEKQHYDAVLTNEFLKDYLPSGFEGTYVFQDFTNGSLSKKDRQYINSISRRYPFSFYFRFKCMCRIAAYSDLFVRFSPDIVFCSAEYSFTSSVLTDYCEKCGKTHINLMHGEKLFNLSDGFCRFHQFFVWDDFYVSLFSKLRADKSIFVVEAQRIMDIDRSRSTDSYTYYLQLQNKEQLYTIRKALKQLSKDYSIRPHPVYGTKEIYDVFENEKIEEPSKVSIYDSFATTGTVVSSYSTVLYQAYLLNIPIIIDDVSDPKLFSELKEREYIMLSKPHMLLSEVVKGNEIYV